MKELEVLQKELCDILEKSHPGSIQLKLSDKIKLYNADCCKMYGKEKLRVDYNFDFYGSNATVIYSCNEDFTEFKFWQSEIDDGILMESFSDFLEENEEFLLFVAEKTMEWYEYEEEKELL